MNDILEVILRAILEFIVEVLVRVPGRLVLNWFRQQANDDFSCSLTFVCGLLCWMIMGVVIWGLVVFL